MQSSSQIITTNKATHTHTFFYRPNSLPVAQRTVSVVSTLKRQFKSAKYNHSHATKWGLLKSFTHLLMTAQTHWCIEAILAGCPSRRHQWLTSGLALKLAGYTSSNLTLSMAASYFHTTDVTLLKQCTQRDANSTQCAGCKAEPKIFTQLQTFFPGVWDGQNVISWRWSLPLPTNPVWWWSMYAISSYRNNRPTNTCRMPAHCKHAHRQDR